MFASSVACALTFFALTKEVGEHHLLDLHLDLVYSVFSTFGIKENIK